MAILSIVMNLIFQVVSPIIFLNKVYGYIIYSHEFNISGYKPYYYADFRHTKYIN